MIRLASPALAALLAGCTSINATPATFEGTRWQVTAVNGQATPRTHDYRLAFGNSRVGGRLGCNLFGGSYRVRGDTLVASEIASTAMGCPDHAGAFERNGLAVLRQPMRLNWHSDRRLTLSNAAGSVELELQR